MSYPLWPVGDETRLASGAGVAVRPVGQGGSPGEGRRLAGYVAVIRELYGGAEPVKPRLMRGQFHDVVLSQDIVYRFPRDEDSRVRLAGRAKVLAALARLPLPVAVPEPVSCEHARLPLGRCHVVLRRLPGGPLSARRAASSAAAVAAQLARLLDSLLAAGSEPALAGLIAPAAPDQWHRFAGEVERVLFPLMSPDGRQRAAAELRAVTELDPVGGALAHEDLGGTNLRWDLAGPEPRLTGVLDWDGAYLGSQVADLASLAVSYGWRIAAELTGLRRGAGQDDVGQARVIAATFALQQALPAALSGDAAMLADGLAGYRR